MCDIRVASETAQFGCPEVKWTSCTGTARNRIGLVQEVVPSDRLLSRAYELAETICSNAPMAVRMTKELALRSRDLTLPDGIRFYQALNRLVEMSEDLEEGTRAFAEKRTPNFRNR